MFFYILGIVSISATVLAWIFDEKTEAEKKQERIRRELDDLKEKFGEVEKDFQKRHAHLYRKHFATVVDKLVAEAKSYWREKEKIGEDLNELRTKINDMLQKPSLSPYLKNGLKRELIYLEEASNRLNAYFRYLAWYTGTLKFLLKKERFYEIQQLGIPDSRLPDDWLYLGKLVLLDSADELDTVNRYRQKLVLGGVYDAKSNSFDFTPEKEALSKYNSDIPLLIYSEAKPIFEGKAPSDENVEPRFALFRGSVLRGELYIHHILPGAPFEVKPRNERLDKDENYYYYKDAISCKMKRMNKKFPLKRYFDTDTLYVYVLEHDLLLKQIWVSEKPIPEANLAVSFIYLVCDNEKFIEELHETLSNPQVRINLTHLNLYEKQVVFRIEDLSIFCSIEDSYFKVHDFRREPTQSTVAIELPFNFSLVTETLLKENLDFMYDIKDAFTQALNFMETEFSYIQQGPDLAAKDYEIFKKWLNFVEWQIEKEEIDYKKLYYTNISKVEGPIEGFQNFVEIQLASGAQNAEALAEIDKEIQQMLKRKHGPAGRPEVRVALKLRYSPKERYFLCPIGILEDDVDLENKKLKVRLDGLLPTRVEYDPKNELFIGLYRFPSDLYRQKKALIRFQKGEMVKPELKKMLISPSLIRSSVDTLKEKAVEKAIVWKNPTLTENQKEIIKRVILEPNLFLIQGPPGTGKTTVIKEIVHQYLKENSKGKCLIVSQQNVAVDNALIRIYQDNKEEWFIPRLKTMIRVAVDQGKVAEELQDFIVDKWFSDYKARLYEAYRMLDPKDHRLRELMSNWIRLIDRDDISLIDREVADVLLNSHQIIGATCVGFANKKLGMDRATFDLVIIDEAARASLPELLIPILRAKKVVLIGDQYQLPPSLSRYLVDDPKLDFVAEDFLEKSLFERLFEEAPESNKGILTDQFRMPKEVGDMISRFFYKSMLQNGVIKSTKNFISPRVIEWIDVRGKNRFDQTSRYNIEEVLAIKALLIDILNKIPEGASKDVAIITPYSAQKRLIRANINNLEKSLNLSKLKIKCDTVDSFQGQEADIVIYSCVRTDGNLSFLLDKRRLNVALSRVRENLFIVGHKQYLYNAEVEGKENLFRAIIDYIDSLN